MRLLVVAAIWVERPGGHMAAAHAVRDRLRDLKLDGTHGAVLTFPADHPGARLVLEQLGLEQLAPGEAL